MKTPISRHVEFPTPAQWTAVRPFDVEQVFFASTSAKVDPKKPLRVLSVARNGRSARLNVFSFPVLLKDLWPTCRQALDASAVKFQQQIGRIDAQLEKLLTKRRDLVARGHEFCQREGLAQFSADQLLVEGLNVSAATSTEHAQLCEENRGRFERWYADLYEGGVIENLTRGPSGYYRKASAESAWLAFCEGLKAPADPDPEDEDDEEF